MQRSDHSFFAVISTSAAAVDRLLDDEAAVGAITIRRVRGKCLLNTALDARANSIVARYDYDSSVYNHLIRLAHELSPVLDLVWVVMLLIT